MFDLTSLLLILVGIGAGFVQRVSGFGLGIFAMLFMPHFMPSAAEAATVSCLFSVGTSTYNAIRYRKDIPYKTVLPLMIAALISIPIAVRFSATVPQAFFERLLGVVLVGISIWFLFFDQKISIRPTTVNGALAGALGGTLNGLFSTGGPPVVLYLSHACATTAAYFAGIQFYFAVTNVYAVAMRAFNGLLSWQLLLYAAIGMIGCMAGDFLGRKVFHKLNAARLKKVIYGGMIVSGILMLF
jgi:uncharacterized membrane protein YfcA